MKGDQAATRGTQDAVRLATVNPPTVMSPSEPNETLASLWRVSRLCHRRSPDITALLLFVVVFEY